MKKSSPVPTNSEPTPENVLSLTYRGALPEILRTITVQLENGSAIAAHFTARVSHGTFELSTAINLIPK